MEVRIKVQGWHCQQLFELAAADNVSPTKYISNLLTMAALSAQENKHGKEKAANTV